MRPLNKIFECPSFTCSQSFRLPCLSSEPRPLTKIHSLPGPKLDFSCKEYFFYHKNGRLYSTISLDPNQPLENSVTLFRLSSRSPPHPSFLLLLVPPF